jgi:hypothetical protein
MAAVVAVAVKETAMSSTHCCFALLVSLSRYWYEWLDPQQEYSETLHAKPPNTDFWRKPHC